MQQLDELIYEFHQQYVSEGGCYLYDGAAIAEAITASEWLNQQLAEAWDAGARRRNGDSFMRENYSQTLAKNPYRQEES